MAETEAIKTIANLVAPAFWVTINIVWSALLKKGMNRIEKERQAEKEAKQKQVRELENLQLGLKAILHDSIYTKSQSMLYQGWASASDKRNLEYLYRPYHDMGGNGTGTALYTAVLELPTRNNSIERGEKK